MVVFSAFVYGRRRGGGKRRANCFLFKKTGERDGCLLGLSL